MAFFILFTFFVDENRCTSQNKAFKFLQILALYLGLQNLCLRHLYYIAVGFNVEYLFNPDMLDPAKSVLFIIDFLILTTILYIHFRATQPNLELSRYSLLPLRVTLKDIYRYLTLKISFILVGFSLNN